MKRENLKLVKKSPVEPDLMGQNGAINKHSRIIGGSIQGQPKIILKRKKGESFEYVNPETESYDTKDGHTPKGERQFRSNGAGINYGGHVDSKDVAEEDKSRLDYTGSNGEIRREINRHAEEGIPPNEEESKGTPPPVK